MHLDTVTVFACEGFHFDEMKSPSFLIRVENTPHSKCRPVVHCVCVYVCVYVQTYCALCVCMCVCVCAPRNLNLRQQVQYRID